MRYLYLIMFGIDLCTAALPPVFSLWTVLDLALAGLFLCMYLSERKEWIHEVTNK